MFLDDRSHPPIAFKQFRVARGTGQRDREGTVAASLPRDGRIETHEARSPRKPSLREDLDDPPREEGGATALAGIRVVDGNPQHGPAKGTDPLNTPQRHRAKRARIPLAGLALREEEEEAAGPPPIREKTAGGLSSARGMFDAGRSPVVHGASD
jgi:hypothetical protein